MINSIALELTTKTKRLFSLSHSFLPILFVVVFLYMKNNKNSLGASFFLSLLRKKKLNKNKIKNKQNTEKDTQLIINIILFHVASCVYGKKVRKREREKEKYKKKKSIRLQNVERGIFLP